MCYGAVHYGLWFNSRNSQNIIDERVLPPNSKIIEAKGAKSKFHRTRLVPIITISSSIM